MLLAAHYWILRHYYCRFHQTRVVFFHYMRHDSFDLGELLYPDRDRTRPLRHLGKGYFLIMHP